MELWHLAPVCLVASACTDTLLDLRAASPAGAVFRRELSVDGALVAGTSAHVGFPVRVEIEAAAELRAVADGGHVSDPEGDDIRFLQDGGALDFEIERYDPAEGTLHAWVRIPSLAAGSDTLFHLEYGDASITTSGASPAAVWSDGFRGVWHLEEDPTAPAPQAQDSTSNAHDAACGGGMDSSALVPGPSGGALVFDGVDDKLTVQGQPSLDLTGPVTISAWLYLNVAQADLMPYARIASKFYGSDGGYGLFFGSPPTRIQMTTADGSTQDIHSRPISLSPGVWYHIAGTWAPAPGRKAVYLDGASLGDDPSSNTLIANPNPTLTIAGDDGNYLDGRLDEVRLSHVARSPEWLSTEYRSMLDPASFCVVGPETAAP